MSDTRIGVRQDIVELITSEEADGVTPLMNKIYYRLLLAPPQWWEGGEALRVRGGTREGVTTTAWAELVDRLGVPPEEARKALGWLDEKGVISYREGRSGREIGVSFAGIYFPG